MVEAHNTVIEGRHIRVEQARVNRTLFIGRLNRTMNEEVYLVFFFLFTVLIIIIIKSTISSTTGYPQAFRAIWSRGRYLFTKNLFNWKEQGLCFC